eukprot:TRINITY_DN32620_c0_g1_i1.p1 TRINITY_DN32620_c0_g1~~TRINITY_DN32620_c0_g1_i1.p1  ORF type:complete len:263 (-),score=26.11 TRINITY_DN32620_c0_g1_i1:495-1283(-)
MSSPSSSDNTEGKHSPAIQIIRVHFPGDPTPHLAAPCLDEDHLLSYMSYLDSLERSEWSSPNREHAGCNIEGLRELIRAQPSAKRQHSVRKSVLRREELMQSTGLGNLVVQFLKLFPGRARLPGELQNLHPIYRFRSDSCRLALQEQSAADMSHYVLIACGDVKTTPLDWSSAPGEVKVLVARYLVPGPGLLCLNRPSPAMWYEHVASRADRRVGALADLCGDVRASVFESLAQVKDFNEKQMVLRIAFCSWRLFAHSIRSK